MAEIKRSTIVKVANPQGLHMRLARLFVECAQRFHSKIEVIKNNDRVDGKSIMHMMGLGAEQGTELSIEAVGEDAGGAVEALCELFQSELFQTGFQDDDPA